EAAIWHRIAAHLNYLPVRACSFEAQFLLSVFNASTEFFVDSKDVKFATPREDTEVISIGRTLGQEVFRKVRDLLEIAVPRRQPKRSVEHSHTIDHIVEGDPQFRLTLPQFVKESRIFHRDDRLRREVLQ